MNKNSISVTLVAATLAGLLPACTTPRAGSTAPLAKSTAVFSVRDFGARGDGETLDTKAIQKTIDSFP